MIDEITLDQAIKALFRDIQFQAQPEGLYDPLRYMIAIGGKRLRPRLCLLCYSLFRDGESPLGPEILEPAAGLEVFHTFTLIHDDIMDRSALRRGHATVWKKWSEDTAILSGDVMCIDAYKRIAQAPAAVLPEALALFSRTAAQVCDGQQLDMDFELRKDVRMDEYLEMIGLKTGVLIACAAELGALIGGADAAARAALYRYGYQLGLAFQVADDYLDAYGDEQVFGKPIGGDILNAKQSWLTIRAREKGAPGLAEAFYAPAETPQEQAAKIAAVKALYNQVDVAADARATIARLSDQAIAEAAGVGLSPEALDRLRSFALQLVGRTM